MVEADLERAEERAELGEKYVFQKNKQKKNVWWTVLCCPHMSVRVRSFQCVENAFCQPAHIDP